MKAYRVTQGAYCRWFKSAEDAKQFADDRWDNEFDGVPFVEEYQAAEVIQALNELEHRFAGLNATQHNRF
jgi:hypothetical protein